MRVLVMALWLAGCGRIGFDATGDGGGGDADPPLPDAMMFTAPCEQPRHVGTADATTELNVAAEGTLYRATWIDSNQKMHVFGIERTGDAVAVQERIFGASAFLPAPVGSDVEIAGGSTVAITWGATQTEVRQLLGSQLATGKSTAYGALLIDLARNGTQMVALRKSGDLFAQSVDPVMLAYGDGATLEMQMTELERAVPLGDGLMFLNARPNADDCDVRTYSPALALRGESPVPSDQFACDEIVGAYATTGETRVIAYTYAIGGMTEIRVQPLSADAVVGAPIAVDGGTGPRIASGGTRFRVAFRNGTGVVRLVTLSNDLAVTGSAALHDMPVARYALASNADEVLAMWVTTTNELWFERLCGP